MDQSSPRNQSTLAKVIASVVSIFLVAIGVYVIKNKEDNKTDEGTSSNQVPSSNAIEAQESVIDETREDTGNVEDDTPTNPAAVSPTPATPPASTAPQTPAPSKSSSPSKSTKTS